VVKLVRAQVLMAEGFEEIELSSIADILRRGGVAVTIAGLKDGLITGLKKPLNFPKTPLRIREFKAADACVMISAISSPCSTYFPPVIYTILFYFIFKSFLLIYPVF
jgi:putative intracellular protease/amidase